jgi:hypothetical protein
MMKISPHQLATDPQISAVTVALDGAELDALDNWINMQGEPHLSRAEGIRMMMVMALNDRRQRPRHDHWASAPASDANLGE